MSLSGRMKITLSRRIPEHLKHKREFLGKRESQSLTGQKRLSGQSGKPTKKITQSQTKQKTKITILRAPFCSKTLGCISWGLIDCN